MKYITAKQFHDNAKCLICSRVIGGCSRYCSLHASYCTVSIGTKIKNNLLRYSYFYDLKYKNYIFEIFILKNKNYVCNSFEIYEIKTKPSRRWQHLLYCSRRIPKFMLLPGEQIIKEIEKIKCLEIFE